MVHLGMAVNRAVVSGFACRAFSASSIAHTRFRPPQAPLELTELGHFLPKKADGGHYKAGQLFMHSVFSYRGIIICSFNVKVHNKPKPKEAIGSDLIIPFYQVLIHRQDWTDMRIAHDQSSYLTQGTGREAKLLSVVNGMDCVSHSEVIPYSLHDPTSNKEEEPQQRVTPPIDHDLFPRLFEPSSAEEGLNFAVAKEQIPNQIATQQCCLTPQAVFTEISHGVDVQVMTFYLGMHSMRGQQLHCWRYSTRVHNLEKRNIILRGLQLKVFSLNHLNQITGEHINGMHPCLSPHSPVFQFSSHINLLAPKGGYMWGKLIAEHEDGNTFEVTVPTVPLEVWSPSDAGEQSENINI